MNIETVVATRTISGGVALVASVGLHLAGFTMLPQPEVEIAGGAPAQLAMLGNSFKNMTQGVINPQQATITDEHLDAAIPTKNAEPPDIIEPVEPKLTVSAPMPDQIPDPAPDSVLNPVPNPAPVQTAHLAPVSQTERPVSTLRQAHTPLIVATTMPKAAESLSNPVVPMRASPTPQTNRPLAATETPEALAVVAEAPTVSPAPEVLQTTQSTTGPVTRHPGSTSIGAEIPLPEITNTVPEIPSALSTPTPPTIGPTPDVAQLPPLKSIPQATLPNERLAALAPLAPLEALEAGTPVEVFEPTPDTIRPVARPHRATPTPEPPAPTKPKATRKPKTLPKPSGGNEAAQRGQSDGNTAGVVANSSRQQTNGSNASGNAAVSNYPGLVLRKIRRTRKERAGAKGTASIGFRIAPNGGVTSLRILRSSGSAKIDQIALRHIQRSGPFPPPPKGARQSFRVDFVSKR